MAIVIDYGDIGPALAAAKKAGFIQQRNENARLGLQAQAIQNEMTQAYMNAQQRAQAAAQDAYDRADERDSRAGIAQMEMQTRADMAGAEMENQWNRDIFHANRQDQREERQNFLQNQRDDRLFQQRLAYDRENDARTFQNTMQARLVHEGVPLEPTEQLELTQLRRGMAEYDRQLARGEITATDHQRMVGQLAPRLSYLDTRAQASEHRVRQTAEEEQRRMARRQIVFMPDPNSPEVMVPGTNTPARYGPDHQWANMIVRRDSIPMQMVDGVLQDMPRTAQRDPGPRPISPAQYISRLNAAQDRLDREWANQNREYDAASEQERRERAMERNPPWTGRNVGPLSPQDRGRILRNAAQEVVNRELEAAGYDPPTRRTGSVQNTTTGVLGSMISGQRPGGNAQQDDVLGGGGRGNVFDNMNQTQRDEFLRGLTTMDLRNPATRILLANFGVSEEAINAVMQQQARPQQGQQPNQGQRPTTIFGRQMSPTEQSFLDRLNGR